LGSTRLPVVHDMSESVYVVAIAELNAPIEMEAAALASDLGVTPYEARLVLAPGLPAVVRRTVDKSRALDLLGRLRARGHGAIACDASAVVASDAMVSMRRFRLGPMGISLGDAPSANLPYDDVLALVAAVHRRRTANEAEVRDRKLSVTRAVLSGGFVTTRTVTRETHATAEERDPVLYIFRRSGGAPWLLREHGTNWAGLDGPIGPSACDNFRTTVGLLRERMPGAVYDDRLVARRSAPERMAISGSTAATTVTTSSEAAIDLLAHLVAQWIARATPA
jgi:hypothetical protein